MVIEKKFAPGTEPDPSEYLFVSTELRLKAQSKPYDAKTACWVPDDADGFVVGELKETKGETCTVFVKNEEKVFKKPLVMQVNPPKMEMIEDMSNMTYLNDASVLNNLKQRYYNKLIYTYSGLFCVAINPYKRFPIYTSRAMKIYQGKRRNEVPPHIFAIAEGAYQSMINDRENQSILITGESGAGKTENTKKVIAYFAAVGASGKQTEKKISLEDQIIQTNPVLESFGNAKTTRNDNSSRFGKFIRIHFGPTGKLAGGDIESYLLEKARVISQMPLERCYHIFYQLMSNAISGMKETLCLSDNIYDYHFVSQGKITINGVDDGEEMQATHEAFEILNFEKEERENIYKITAACMHIGELKFKQKGREEQAEADGLEAGINCGKLLGINGEDLYKNICKPKIKTGNEFVTKGQNVLQCGYTLGSMAKSMYDRLFKYLVKRCNDTLDTKNKKASFGGVLDIAGFEIFEENGFDQLCINFTNEKLQQFFNHHMFVLEQEEYKKEGLDWVFEDFGMDLQACIDAFEKPMGIFACLEEQTMFPKATDATFQDMLKTNLMGKSPCFVKPKPAKPGQKEAHFAIAHYAGTVAYNITGWLEKNKDPLNDTVVDQYKKGTNKLLCTLYGDHPGQSGDAAAADSGKGKGGGKKKGGFASVSSSYREQLNNLMTTLRATHPHFIRCIIPNEVKTPGLIDSHLVMHQLTCNGVLEGIRICRKGFPNRMLYPDFKHRYIILAAEQMKAASADDKKMATACFETIGLEAEKYRVGHTKVFFRAGTLGILEEYRDEKIGKIVTWMQATIRSFVGRMRYKVLQEQRVALQVVQRAIKAYMSLKNWEWFMIMKMLKPLIDSNKIGEALTKMEDKAARVEEHLQNEIRLKEEALKTSESLKAEIFELTKELEVERSKGGDYSEKLSKLASQKQDLEGRLSDTQEKLVVEEKSRAEHAQAKKKLDHEFSGLKKELEDMELSLNKVEGEKNTRDHQIRAYNEEIARQDDVINKLNKEKKHLQELGAKTSEELQGAEDKVNHLNKVKNKLDQTMDELEDSLEREKKLRADLEKSKRKIEGDLRVTQEAVNDLERNKKELEGTISRKDKDIQNLSVKLEDEQSVVSKLQKQIRELQGRIEELEEELEAERGARAKAEKQKSDLARESEELAERLEEAGGATAAQIELNKKREAELVKLRKDLEEHQIQHESTLVAIRKKHNDAVAEMSEQIDTLNKMKAKAERERTQMGGELNDVRTSMEQLSNQKYAFERQNKQWQGELSDMQTKYDNALRTLSDIENSKKKLLTENSELTRSLEDVESQTGALNKVKIQLAQQLDDMKRTADQEARERSALLSKFRNIEHDQDALREQLDEEAAAKADLMRQLSKAAAEAQLWRAKYESEGIGKVEELEDSKRKLQCRLTEAEESIESMNSKVIALEKAKQIKATELEDMLLEVERCKSMEMQMGKKQRFFDKILEEWKTKADDCKLELDGSQKECRNYSTELYRLKANYEEVAEQLDGLRRENKSLTDEIKDLMDQIGDGGRHIHELDKARRRLEQEKDELQAALEEAESALEQEENKVIRGQLELGQVRQEIDRRLQEKDDEFATTKKTHQRALEQMQASLEAEAKGKAEAFRMKKKLECDINELEMALDSANKTTVEYQKNIKKYQLQLKELQGNLEEEQKGRESVRDALSQAERRGNALSMELEESRTLLESADRARRTAEQELGEANDSLNDFQGQVQSLSVVKRKLESEIQTLHTDLEEVMNEARNSEEKSKKAMLDAARLADELRVEQENALCEEKNRKSLEIQMKDLQSRLDEAETAALKAGKKTIAKLEEQIRVFENDLDGEQRRHAECQKSLRKNERKIKELSFQAEEDKKNHQRIQELVDTLQSKIKTYKRQIEEAEEIAALNLAKFRQAQAQLEDAEQRSELAEMTLSKMRAQTRAASTAPNFD